MAIARFIWTGCELRGLRAIANQKETQEEKNEWWKYVLKNRPDIKKRMLWNEDTIENMISKFY